MAFLLGSLKTTSTSIIISLCVKVLDVKLLAFRILSFLCAAFLHSHMQYKFLIAHAYISKFRSYSICAKYSPVNSPDFISAFYSPIINLLICNKISQTLYFASVCNYYHTISDSGRGCGSFTQTSIRLHLALY